MKRIITLALIAASAQAAFGFGFSDIQNWTGSGANQSALVIDWNDGKTHESLAWGFRWDGAATGGDLIHAVLAADPHLQAEIESFSFGDALKGWSYDADLDGLLTGPADHNESGFGFPGEGFWSYYLGGPSSTFPSWGFAATGADGRSLEDGSWDGWSWTPDGGDSTDPSEPAAAPVPEPASLLALGLGALALRRRRK